MKSFLLVLGLFIITTASAREGQDLYDRTCKACHTIGQGRLVGPDLLNISSRRDRAWLIDFIRSSQKMINAGDSVAIAIYAEYNKMPMPDANLTNAQIEAIIDYIGANNSEGNLSGKKETLPNLSAPATQENTDAGARLFSGEEAFLNQGPSCAICHKVTDRKIFSNGTLAKSLTTSYTIMGSAGITAILNSPPFPAMKDAYINSPLTGEEVLNLTAYLKTVSDKADSQIARDDSLLFFLSGLFIFVIIFASTYIFYVNRKQGSVNDSIIKRQIRTIN